MRYLVLLFLITAYSVSEGQNTVSPIIDYKNVPKVPIVDTAIVYQAVQQPPQFRKDFTAWNKYLQVNLKYPDKAKRDLIQGKVFLSFVVERDGRLDDIKVVRSLTPECDAEAIRLIKSSPKWRPGRMDGKRVKVQYCCPVKFILDKRLTEGTN